MFFKDGVEPSVLVLPDSVLALCHESVPALPLSYMKIVSMPERTTYGKDGAVPHWDIEARYLTLAWLLSKGSDVIGGGRG